MRSLQATLFPFAGTVCPYGPSKSSSSSARFSSSAAFVCYAILRFVFRSSRPDLLKRVTVSVLELLDRSATEAYMRSSQFYNTHGRHASSTLYPAASPAAMILLCILAFGASSAPHRLTKCGHTVDLPEGSRNVLNCESALLGGTQCEPPKNGSQGSSTDRQRKCQPCRRVSLVSYSPPDAKIKQAEAQVMRSGR
ncbi:hypothetical protein DOTSEDRAFT_36500 [Dothistroma septosporum NZE10]|uniref:Uncharacterized protein n=1 Tax=Dothistroma septosporum (strain NZE10 / CBS 128990) TaxID=675120 RepID=N1PMH7_DOTSN|nr:hypothetical protein DOTSEDRAFT_36500 [Dothistroma septosporum NZE10]